MIDVYMDGWNSPLDNDDARMNKFNTYVLLVSATPFAETSVNTNAKKVFVMPYGAGYYGIWDMIRANNFVDHHKIPCLKHNASARRIKTGFENLFRFKNGFVFVRENTKSFASMNWVVRFKAMLDSRPDVIYFSLNADTNTVKTVSGVDKPVGIIKAYLNAGCSMDVIKRVITTSSRYSPPAVGIDAILCVEPEQIVVIFIKEMLLAGKTLDTLFVRMVIDLPLVNDDLTNCDRYAQGLMGRCCGYGKKEHSVK
ncbi:hypothetical protein B484DRAFT_470874, partial [Ochromonadaceae sp. CCMP2298]